MPMHTLEYYTVTLQGLTSETNLEALEARTCNR
jgi:hypothetical protein